MAIERNKSRPDRAMRRAAFSGEEME